MNGKPMNPQELKTEEIARLIAELNAELNSRAKAEKVKLVDEIREKAEALNIPLADLLQEVSKPKKRKIGMITPKYRNPDNPDETWSGRGHKPKWMLSQLKKGKSLDDLLISVK